MKKKPKLVMRTPLKTLWNEHGDLPHKRFDFLTREQVKNMLDEGPVEFVVASISSEISWIPVEECHTFWKKELETNLASDDGDGFSLEDFPNHYAYIASEWMDPDGKRVILLEVHH